MRFPTKPKCREWVATFAPSEVVGRRSHPTDCPIAMLIRHVIGPIRVRISVVPPLVKLYEINSFGRSTRKVVASARIPRWARDIIVGVDMNLPPQGRVSVTAAEVAALLH
jgi:hypothetical protein